MPARKTDEPDQPDEPPADETPEPAVELSPDESYIHALEFERAGYEMRGLGERVKQVDAEIKRAKG